MTRLIITAAVLFVTVGCFAQTERATSDDTKPSVPYIQKPGSFAVAVRGSSQGLHRRQPLFILDGVKIVATAGNNFNGIPREVADLDVNSVESITVVKDSTALASYGPEAVNGVIIIKTKEIK